MYIRHRAEEENLSVQIFAPKDANKCLPSCYCRIRISMRYKSAHFLPAASHYSASYELAGFQETRRFEYGFTLHVLKASALNSSFGNYRKTV